MKYTGIVDDLSQLYQRSRVICCPITVAGGTRVKLVEAAGYGKPMVSTAIGAEGLDMADNLGILIRDSDDDIAEASTATGAEGLDVLGDTEILVCNSDDEIAKCGLYLVNGEELSNQLGSAACERQTGNHEIVAGSHDGVRTLI